ncbi:MAG: FAD-dependent oxidoreductase [Acidobacteria bacterium]|nr:FAD-dependent oxidoreductase [Acidobacteriota bacterium]
MATAFYLAQARKGGAAVEEFLFEGSSRLGGVLRTEQLAGCLVEAGADSFLSEKKEALELCRGLGLDGQVIGSEDHQRRTWILHRGELVPLPDGFEFFVPVRPWAVARTRLLSWKDKLRMLREPWVRALNPSQDESVASFVERHFGRGLVEAIVDPLLNGVYGGDAGS